LSVFDVAVFIDPMGESPYLLEIHQGKGATVKSYPELNSADTACPLNSYYMEQRKT
jgi:hypothetical protein